MSKFFINRPIVAMVISIVMVIVGIVAFLDEHGSQIRQSYGLRQDSSVK